MRKIAAVLIVLMLTLILASCNDGETHIITPIKDSGAKPVQSFGNIHNQQVKKISSKYKCIIHGEKKLVYRAAEPISKILLYDGDILITLADSGIYIKKDGTAIKLKVH